eukprot:m.213828 g.213828  ORF g.213828 m.213828 type:complete len:564 (+) comp26178_c0_seq4:84-1775(+)
MLAILSLFLAMTSAVVYNDPVPVFDAPNIGSLHGGSLYNGRYYAGEAIAGATYSFDLESGDVRTEIPAPLGSLDDVAIRPSDGLIVGSYLMAGTLTFKWPNGTVETAAELAAINPVRFTADERLIVAPCFLAFGIYEYDFEKRQLVPLPNAESLMVNSFDFDQQGLMYAPDIATGTVIRYNIETGEKQVLADGFSNHWGVALDKDDNVYVLQGPGHIMRLDEDGKGGYTKVDIFHDTSVTFDNFEIDRDRHAMFVAQMSPAGILKIDLGDPAFPATYLFETKHSKYWSLGSVIKNPETGGNELLFAALLGVYRMPLDGPQQGKPITLLKGATPELPIFSMESVVTENRVYVSCVFSGVVMVYNRSNMAPQGAFTGTKQPRGIAALGPNKVVLAEAGAVKEYTIPINISETTSRTLIPGIVAFGIAASPDGKYIFATDIEKGTLVKYARSTGAQQVVLKNLHHPEALTIVPLGEGQYTLAMVEAGTKSLLLVNPETSATQLLSKSLPLFQHGPLPKPVFRPTGSSIVADDKGNIYVLDSQKNGIVVFKRDPKPNPSSFRNVEDL